MKKNVLRGLIVVLGLSVVLGLMACDDKPEENNNQNNNDKVVEEKYRGIYTTTKVYYYDGGYHSIDMELELKKDTMIYSSVDINNKTYYCYTEGTELYATGDTVENSTKNSPYFNEGYFIDDNTLVHPTGTWIKN